MAVGEGQIRSEVYLEIKCMHLCMRISGNSMSNDFKQYFLNYDIS